MIGEKLLAAAMSKYGLKEVTGPNSNEQLLKIIKTVIPWAKDDSSVSWCAIFMSYLFDKVGYSHLIPSNPAGARSWMKVKGETIWKRGDDEKDIGTLAKPGDIVVFWRSSLYSWKGHVALFLNVYHYDHSRIRVLGGNQSDGVLIRPYSKSRILKIIRV